MRNEATKNRDGGYFMNNFIIDGKEISAQIKEEVKKEAERQKEKGKSASLAVILV